MTLPASVRDPVEAALDELGFGSQIASSRGVGGGCINNSVRIETAEGTHCFLKWNPTSPTGLFAAEAAGLVALRSAAAVRVPQPLAWSSGGSGPGWLLMEYIAATPAAADSDERLGRGLAGVHLREPEARSTSLGPHGGVLASDTPSSFGWHEDNWIGALSQSNDVETSWAVFWRDHRIVPQLRRARRENYLSDPKLDRVVELIPKALDDVETPELLHGDLWSGNAYFSAGGDPVLVDPAVYHGDGEVDLAMAELFGGFGPRFFHAYQEARPISPAYEAYRRDLYQLYYLLVHVNLFGASYEGSTSRAAARVVAALG